MIIQTIKVLQFHLIFEQGESSNVNANIKWVATSFQKLYGKVCVVFFLNTEKRLFAGVSF